MAFDLKKYETTKGKDNIADVPVPELKQFFDDDEEPVFQVRGLTSMEHLQAKCAVDNQDTRSALVAGIMSESGKEKADAIKEAIGLTDDAPGPYIENLEMFIRGIVKPEGIKKPIAVKIANETPTVFFRVVAKIKALTGEGKSLGESKPSTGGQKSKAQ